MIQLTLTEQQTDQVLHALGQLPFMQVNGLIGTILKQVQAQQQQRQRPVVLPEGAYNGEAVAVGSGSTQ